ncbi:MAG: hypothetical protein PHI98_11150 [Eubacteriales bacterium]|nr:hypothetical protein [Eubacteriales bacterium]
MRRCFLIGSIGYPILELLYRRRTHPAMALAGGVSLCGLRLIDRATKKRPLWQGALLGGAWITAVEYSFGIVLNQRYQIWDYRKTPFQHKGQVCLPFSLAWCGLSAGALLCMRELRRRS